MKTSLQNPPRAEYEEGPIAKALESQTAVPTDTLLWAALASIVGSLTLQLLGRQRESLFVGQWAPTFLTFCVYLKLAKSLGAERAGERELL